MKIADLILIGALLIVAIVFLNSSTNSNSTVVIQYQNKIIGQYPLDVNRKVVFNGALGKMEIQIKNGKVRMLKSNCPLHLCIKQGWISNSSIPIVCVPNKVMIYIKNSKKQDLITK